MSSYLRMIFNSTEVEAINKEGVIDGLIKDLQSKLKFVGDVYESQFIKIFLETIASVLSDGIIVIINVDYEIVYVYKVIEHELIEE